MCDDDSGPSRVLLNSRREHECSPGFQTMTGQEMQQAQASSLLANYMMPDYAQLGDYASYAPYAPIDAVSMQHVPGHQWEPSLMEHEVLSTPALAPPELDQIPLPMSLKKMDGSTKAGCPGSSLSEASLALEYFPYVKNLGCIVQIPLMIELPYIHILVI